MQHARPRHVPLEADDLRLRRCGEDLGDLPRPAPAKVGQHAGAARAARVERAPEHLEQIAVVRPGRQVGNVPAVQLREADQRRWIRRGGSFGAVPLVEFFEQLSFPVGGAGVRFTAPCRCQDPPSPVDSGRTTQPLLRTGGCPGVPVSAGVRGKSGFHGLGVDGGSACAAGHAVTGRHIGAGNYS
jgi:hypothetical protein